MDSIQIKIYPYLSTSFDVVIKRKQEGKVVNKKKYIVHTDETLIIEGKPTNQDTLILESIFKNK